MIRDEGEVIAARSYPAMNSGCPWPGSAAGVYGGPDERKERYSADTFAARAATTTPAAKSVAIFSGGMPQSASVARVPCPNSRGGVGRPAGVRLKRGAGAGCTTPSISTKELARDIVRMVRRLIHRENRRETGVRAFQQLAPFVSGARPESLFELACAAPARHRRYRAGRAARTDLRGISARSPQSKCSGRRRIRRFVDRRSGIEQVGAALEAVQPGRIEPVKMVISEAAPSAIAASTTCPLPDRCASMSAHAMPKAR